MKFSTDEQGSHHGRRDPWSPWYRPPQLCRSLCPRSRPLRCADRRSTLAAWRKGLRRMPTLSAIAGTSSTIPPRSASQLPQNAPTVAECPGTGAIQFFAFSFLRDRHLLDADILGCDTSPIEEIVVTGSPVSTEAILIYTSGSRGDYCGSTASLVPGPGVRSVSKTVKQPVGSTG
jgi:hypothetical protein